MFVYDREQGPLDLVGPMFFYQAAVLNSWSAKPSGERLYSSRSAAAGFTESPCRAARPHVRSATEPTIATTAAMTSGSRAGTSNRKLATTPPSASAPQAPA